MKISNFILSFIFIGWTSSICAQDIAWTKSEMEYYSKTKQLCTFLKSNPYDTSKRKFIFENFIFFNNVKNDTTQNRINYFDMLLYTLYHFVDSVGIENLDAKPLRYFKNDNAFYKPFEEDLKWADSLVLVYYDKRTPKKPIGSLLYEPKSRKLISWVMLNMGGYLFLTPNIY